MKKIFSLLLICVWAVTAYAVPAYPGWQTRTQADGTTIEVQVIGDEFYHYTINREGKEVREVNGQFKVVGDAPTAEQVYARHEKARAIHDAEPAGSPRRAPKAVGTTPNLAPKGIVILVNFKDSKMSSSHTQAVWDELCNSTNCTVNVYGNKSYPSAGQYFADQSNGSYRPQFDIFGPVTLSQNYAYYGEDIDPNDAGSDRSVATAVVEACKLIDQQFSVNWADYDSDGDYYVDFVYMIFAGKGQANGGDANTIWPHNWNIYSAWYYGKCEYDWNDCNVGEYWLNNYACSAELVGNGGMSGIGTLCHEFGHVMGLPDLYDITYGDVYHAGVTPNDWNIMDAGSYNGGEHCPPNYDPWQKLFFGWQTPIVLGTEGADIVLKANGTEGAQVYQIASTSSLKGATQSGLRYYIENRQQVGWDEPLTGHGMLLWKVDFNANAWTSNSPNATGTDGAPRHTVISAYGTKIGGCGDYNEQGQFISGSYKDNCPWNPFPGTKKVYTCTPINGHQLTEITESNGIITAKYNGGYVPTSFSYQVTNAEHCTASSMSGDKTPGDTLFLTIIPDDNYTLDDASCWNVTMGGQKLKYGEGYTYIAASNLFVLPDMSGDVTISASALRTYLLTWYAQGEVFKKTITTGTLSIPSAVPASCEDTRAFVGWCETEIYENEWTAPEYIQNGEAVTEDRNFYAVFAEQLAENLFDDFTTTCTPVQHNYYKIRFFDNGAQIGEEQTIREGFLPALPNDPTPVCPEIYTFVGWWIETLDLKNMEANSVSDFKATKDQDYFAVYRRTAVPAGGAGKLTRFVAGTDQSTSMYLIKDGVTVHVTDGTFSRDDNYRCYTNQTLTVSAEEAISQVLFTCDASGDAQYGPGCFTVPSGGYTYNGKIGIWQGEATSVDFQADPQVRMNSIEVTTGGPASKTYYTTTEDCSLTAIDHTEVEKSAVKAIRDGQLVIIRGDKIYTATGARIE